MEVSIVNGLGLIVDRPFNGPVNAPFLKAGGYNKQTREWGLEVSGPFSRVEFVKPRLSQRLKVMGILLRKGWEPSWYTDKGSPKLTKAIDSTSSIKEPCPNLKKIEGFNGTQLSEFFVYTHRRGFINTMLNNVRGDSRISAGAIACGTNTRRMKHRGVANPPRVTSIYGKEIRELFTVPDGYNMVGADASGLELRILAHYMNDEEYIDQILNGDIHTYNMELAGLDSRDQAKTFVYGFIYGAGHGKIGDIVGGTSRDGKRLSEKFLKGLPKLEKLIWTVKKASRRGWLNAIDGGPLNMRWNKGKVMEHKALNTLLQGTGSVVVKKATILARKATEGYDARQVIHMHDEFQYEVKVDHAAAVANLLEQSFVDAGEYFNLNIPLAGEAKIGNNWSETH